MEKIVIKKALIVLSIFAGAILSSIVFAESGAKHIPGVFFGVLDADGETDSSLGVEYEYKFTHSWGAGIVYEKSNDAHHGDGVTSSIAALYFHPNAGWRLGIGAGREKVGGHHSHTESLKRLGIAYDFHVGHFGIAPTFNIDRVNGENNEVYGIAVTYPF